MSKRPGVLSDIEKRSWGGMIEVKGSKNSNGNAFLVRKWCLYEVNEERRGRCCCDNAIGTEGDRLAEFQN